MTDLPSVLAAQEGTPGADDAAPLAQLASLALGAPFESFAVVGDVDPRTIAAGEAIGFHCNLCGTTNRATLAQLSREPRTCLGCGSNVRFRAIARLVVRELLGEDIALTDVPARPDIAGIGLSDAAPYAIPLTQKFSYENTWYHMAPQLDITDIPAERVGRYDFVVASDVFEHVTPPVGRAFVNARRLLRPGGRFIFTVPYMQTPATVEHFPDLHDWSVIERNGVWVLDNTTAAGQRQRFTGLIFHGGPGSTLEMRVFSQCGLEGEFARAGFARMRIAAEPYLPFGIHWPEPFSVPMVAYAD
jgi:SAM-dependent methyltransferase